MPPIPSPAQLRPLSQPKVESVWYARIFARKISVYLTWVLLHVGMSANQATFWQTAVGVAAGIFLMVGEPAWTLAGLIAIQVSYVLDCVDGEIARFRKTSSMNGVFLDQVNHVLVIPIFFWGIVVFCVQRTGFEWFWFVGMAMSLVAISPIKHALMSSVHYLFRKRTEKYDTRLLKAVSSYNKHEPVLSGYKKVLKNFSEFPDSMNFLSLAVLADLAATQFFSAIPAGWIIAASTLLYVAFIWAKEFYFYRRLVQTDGIAQEYLRYLEGADILSSAKKGPTSNS